MTSDKNLVGTLLSKLRESQIRLAFLATFVIGAASLVLHLGSKRKWFELPWVLDEVPWLAIAEACFAAVIIGLVYERLVRRENELSYRRSVTEALNEFAEKFLTQVTKASLGADGSLARLSPDALDALLEGALASRLGNQSLAREVAHEILPQVTGQGPRLLSLNHHVSFLADNDLLEDPNRYITARVVVSSRRFLSTDVFRFGVAGSEEALYRKLARQTPWDVIWFCAHMIYYKPEDPRTFQVEYVQVDDVALPLQRMSKLQLEAEGMAAGVECPIPLSDRLRLGQEVDVNYCYRVKVPKLGHVITFPITQPSRSVSYDFDLGDVGIERVTVWPFFITADAPQIVESRTAQRISVMARTSRWVLGGGGIALVWRLTAENELSFLGGGASADPEHHPTPTASDTR